MSTCWCGICDAINDLCSNLFGGDRDWGRTGIKGWNGGGNVACARFWVSEWPRKELTEHSVEAVGNRASRSGTGCRQSRSYATLMSKWPG